MSLTLRPYQMEAMQAIDDTLFKHRSTLVEMATGLGKTVVFAHVADRWPGRALIIANRDELVRQAAEKVYEVTGKPASIEMGRESARNELYSTKVTVASIQTLARVNRRYRFHPDHFSIVIIDEGHHAVAASYVKVLDYFPNAKRLFATATAMRGDKVGLGAVCESVAFRYGIEAAINDGWLVPIKQQVVKVDDLDFSTARTVASDFNQADLDQILTEEKPLLEMCGSANEIIGNRQSLWFCNSIHHAMTTAGVLSRYANGEVLFLSGDTPIEERRSGVSRYKKGLVQQLVNCGLFLEGFDAPNTSVIVMARPTKSDALYTQVLGRGTRCLPKVVDGIETAEDRCAAIAASGKPHMTVIDFAGNAGRHKIVQAADVLGGSLPQAIRLYAKQTLEQEGTSVDIGEVLMRAKAEWLLLHQEQQRRKNIKAPVSYRTNEVDPFVREYNPDPPRRRERSPDEMCTEKQASYICHLSRESGGKWTIEQARRLTKSQASGVITKLRKSVA